MASLAAVETSFFSPRRGVFAGREKRLCASHRRFGATFPRHSPVIPRPFNGDSSFHSSLNTPIVRVIESVSECELPVKEAKHELTDSL